MRGRQTVNRCFDQKEKLVRLKTAGQSEMEGQVERRI